MARILRSLKGRRGWAKHASERNYSWYILPGETVDDKKPKWTGTGTVSNRGNNRRLKLWYSNIKNIKIFWCCDDLRLKYTDGAPSKVLLFHFYEWTKYTSSNYQNLSKLLVVSRTRRKYMYKTTQLPLIDRKKEKELVFIRYFCPQTVFMWVWIFISKMKVVWFDVVCCPVVCCLVWCCLVKSFLVYLIC